jgi:prepilin-type N-terminal cleavage/methylation domain-containing protein
VQPIGEQSLMGTQLMPRIPFPRRQFARTGFSVPELMVVMAAIGTLLALVLPAIQSVRESGRQTECRSHLHQFGIALAGFEAVNRRLPSKAGPHVSRNGIEVRYPYSAHFHLLPFFEQRAIYEMIDFRGAPPSIDPRFTKIVHDPIPAFLCPSDSIDHGTNYRLSMGPMGCHVMPESRNDYPDRGAFTVVGGITLAEVLDGLSNTVSMSERYQSDDQTNSFSFRDFWYTGSSAVGPVLSSEEMIAEARGLVLPPAFYYPRAGHAWHKGSFASTCYNHLLEPNSGVFDCSMDSISDMDIIRTNPDAITVTAVGVHLARSFHPGGVHLLMLDGAVHVANDNVDLDTWRRLGRIADTQP